MQTGWQTISGKTYYFNEQGIMRTGWILDNNIWYYLGTDGAMLTGWYQENGYWDYLKPDGFSGWSGPTGSMVNNTTITIDGKSYTFDLSGHCLNP